MRGIIVLGLVIALVGASQARDRAVVREFQRTHVCPSTGKAGKCPGYVVDHVVPLACGGSDSVANMQYQTVEAGKAKDKVERKGRGRRH
jgi:5-methylcytosine-specific restriction endonuclease McrA